jgi:hypothetical protein
MVHALKHTHCLLASEGILVNIQPLPISHTIEIHFPGRDPTISWSVDRKDTLAEQAALDAIAMVISEGYFQVADEHEFEFINTADTIPEFQEVLDYWWETAGEVERTIQRIRNLAASLGPCTKLELRVPARLTKLLVKNQPIYIE